MNFFEQELRKIIGQSTAAADASYVGRSCFVRLNPDLRAKLTFTRIVTIISRMADV